MSAPTSCLFTGQEIAVLLGDEGSLTFIGELGQATVPTRWPRRGSTRRAIARVTGRMTEFWARGRLEDGDQDVAIALKGVTLQPGNRLAVSLVGVHTSGIPSVHPPLRRVPGHDPNLPKVPESPDTAAVDDSSRRD